MNAVPVARILGFEVRIHVSWAIILAVIGVTTATQVADMSPELAGPGSWVAAVVVAGAFLVSALAHELGHAVAARRAGLPGAPIIVYFFGGAASSTKWKPVCPVSCTMASMRSTRVSAVAPS